MHRSQLSAGLSLSVMRRSLVAAQAALVCILLVITRSSAGPLRPAVSTLRVAPLVTAATGAAHPAERRGPVSASTNTEVSR